MSTLTTRNHYAPAKTTVNVMRARAALEGFAESVQMTQPVLIMNTAKSLAIESANRKKQLDRTVKDLTNASRDGVQHWS